MHQCHSHVVCHVRHVIHFGAHWVVLQRICMSGFLLAARCCCHKIGCAARAVCKDKGEVHHGKKDSKHQAAVHLAETAGAAERDLDNALDQVSAAVPVMPQHVLTSGRPGMLRATSSLLAPERQALQSTDHDAENGNCRGMTVSKVATVPPLSQLALTHPKFGQIQRFQTSTKSILRLQGC